MVRIKEETGVTEPQKSEEKQAVVTQSVDKVEKKVDSTLDLEYNKSRKEKKVRKIRLGKLEIPAEAQDPRFTYRWANNSSKRIRELEANEWFSVKDAKLAEQMTGRKGSTVQIGAGLDSQGKEVNMILMAKRIDWYQEDKERMAAENKELEDSIQNHNVENSFGKIEINK